MLTLVLLGGCASQGEWTQWRGTARDGVVVGALVPETLPQALELLWQVPLGKGQATPLVESERIYVFSRLGEREGISCLDRRTGALLWRSDEPVGFKIAHEAALKMGKGPVGTPVLHRGLLYGLGVNGLLSCRRADDGVLVWRQDFAGEFEHSAPYFGASSSPLVVGNTLVAHVGGYGQGALRAFDLATGQVRWSWDEPPSYASPVVLALLGVDQLVVPSQNYVAGLAIDSGQLLWQIPFTSHADETVPTPLAYGGNMVLFGGWERGIRALRVERSAQGWSAEEVWHNPDGSMYTSSPLLNGDQVLGFTHLRKGQFFSFDAESGQTLWQSPGRQAESAALVDAGKVWLALTTNGELLVFDKGAQEFAPLRRYKVADSETWADPVVLEEGVLVREQGRLTMWGWD